MNRLFQAAVIMWGFFYTSWAVFIVDPTLLGWISMILIIGGTWGAIGGLLVRRVRIVRVLLLLAIMGRVVFLAEDANLWMFDWHNYARMSADPSTSWATNVSLLLDIAVLILAYLTLATERFEVQIAVGVTKLRRFMAALMGSDGAMLASLTAVVVVVFVVNQFVIGARYAEHSPHAIVSRAAESVEAAEASGSRNNLRYTYLELGDAYWLLGKHEQAASMYERFLDGVEVSSWGVSESIARLVQFYATGSDARFGDGRAALKMADRLPASLRTAAYFDAVASVYARLGQVEKAIDHQRIAVEMCMSSGWCCEQHWDYAHRLTQYRNEGQ